MPRSQQVGYTCTALHSALGAALSALAGLSWAFLSCTTWPLFTTHDATTPRRRTPRLAVRPHGFLLFAFDGTAVNGTGGVGEVLTSVC